MRSLRRFVASDGDSLGSRSYCSLVSFLGGARGWTHDFGQDLASFVDTKMLFDLIGESSSDFLSSVKVVERESDRASAKVKC
jgi:hypothetical protein